MVLTQFDQPVKAFPVDQRLKVAADADIGRGLSGIGGTLDTDRQIGARNRDIPKVGLERERLVGAAAFGLEIDGDKGGIFDLDADLFDRRDQEIIVIFTDQNRRKEFHQPHAANRGALIEPGAVAFDLHVQIAAKRRVPLLYRRQSACFGGGNRRGKAFCCWGHGFLSTHCFCHFLFTRYTYI